MVMTGCSDDDDDMAPAPGPNEIFMQNIEFVPSNRTVTVETTITSINMDVTAYTASSQDDTFSFTFNAEGTFDYLCTFHPNQMTGTITVEPRSRTGLDAQDDHVINIKTFTPACDSVTASRFPRQRNRRAKRSPAEKKIGGRRDHSPNAAGQRTG